MKAYSHPSHFVKKNALFFCALMVAVLFLRNLIGRSYTHWDTFDLLTVNFTYLSDSLRSGFFPLWNPFTLSGQPMLASLFTNSLFSPIDLVFLALSLVVSPLYLVELNILLGAILFFFGTFFLLQKLAFDKTTSAIFSFFAVLLTAPIIVGQIGFLYSFALLSWLTRFSLDSRNYSWFVVFLRALFLASILVKGYFYFIVLFMFFGLGVSLLTHYKQASGKLLREWFSQCFLLFFIPTVFYILLNFEGAWQFVGQYSDLTGDLKIVEPRLRQLGSSDHFFSSIGTVFKNLVWFQELSWTKVGFGVLSPFALFFNAFALIKIKRNRGIKLFLGFIILFFVFLSSSEKTTYLLTTYTPILSSFRWNFYNVAISVYVAVILAAYGASELMAIKLVGVHRSILSFFFACMTLYSILHGIQSHTSGGRRDMNDMPLEVKERTTISPIYFANDRLLQHKTEFEYNNFFWLKKKIPISHGYNNTVSEYYWRMKDMPLNAKIAVFSCNNSAVPQKGRLDFISDNAYIDWQMSNYSPTGESFRINGRESHKCKDSKSQRKEPDSIRLTPNVIVANFTINEAGVIVITQNAYPGWKAFLNDVEVPILKVNRIFQGVEISKAGSYSLELRYWPLTATLLVLFYSIIAITICFGCGQLYLRRKNE